MKLYIKQKVFSFGSKFSIQDAEGQVRFTVEGEVFSLGRKLHIYDENHTECAVLSQKLLSLLPQFQLRVVGGREAEIVRRLTLFHAVYEVNGLGWTVKGDFGSHDYQIAGPNGAVASIHKKWMSWGDSYELAVENEADVIYAVGVVLAIDAVLDAEDKSAANAAT